MVVFHEDTLQALVSVTGNELFLLSWSLISAREKFCALQLVAQVR